MIFPRHSKVHSFLFNLYLNLNFKTNFSKIQIIGEIKDEGLPVLILANHISWWDGFWVLRLNERLFRRQFYVIMLEDQLKKHIFLSRLGAFSINPGRKNIRESLEYAIDILKDSRKLLLMFPQGEIHSLYDDSFQFQKGLSYILSRIDNPIQILMVAHLVDYLSSKKPILNQYVYSPPAGIKDLQGAYNDFYRACLHKQKETQNQ